MKGRELSIVYTWMAIYRDAVRRRRRQENMLAYTTRDDLPTIKRTLIFFSYVLSRIEERKIRDNKRKAIWGWLCDRPITSSYDLTRAELFAFVDCMVDATGESEHGWNVGFAVAVRAMADPEIPYLMMANDIPVERLEFVDEGSLT